MGHEDNLDRLMLAIDQQQDMDGLLKLLQDSSIKDTLAIDDYFIALIVYILHWGTLEQLDALMDVPEYLAALKRNIAAILNPDNGTVQSALLAEILSLAKDEVAVGRQGLANYIAQAKDFMQELENIQMIQ